MVLLWPTICYKNHAFRRERSTRVPEQPAIEMENQDGDIPRRIIDEERDKSYEKIHYIFIPAIKCQI